MLVGITLLTFLLSHAVPADPVTASLGEQAAADPAVVAAFRHEWGLDRSWPVQYVTFMQNALQGELGKSFNYRLPVSQLYFQRLPNSLTLGAQYSPHPRTRRGGLRGSGRARAT